MDMKKTRQLIRMDHHTPAPDHGVEKRKKEYEIVYWADGNLHYHILKWNQ